MLCGIVTLLLFWVQVADSPHVGVHSFTLLCDSLSVVFCAFLSLALWCVICNVIDKMHCSFWYKIMAASQSSETTGTGLDLTGGISASCLTEWAMSPLSYTVAFLTLLLPLSYPRVLAKLFHLQPSNPRDGILLDLYVYNVLFCRDHHFNKEQTSVCALLCVSETPLGNVSQCFELLRELVLCHSVRRPPFSVDLFDMHQVRLVSEYVVNTYFRHFKLYKYAFTAQVSPPTVRCVVTTSPKAELQQFIQSQLDVEVAKLRENMEEKLKLSAEMLNSKLAQLEDNGKQKEKNQKSARKK
uniref:Cilia and flagella associated protein 119 n=1 Tax=Erpetoichthys calabaricus TaxID=27687 RepID=A0A8C4SJJ1_ERPCA